MGQTPTLGLHYPDSTDVANISQALQTLATDARAAILANMSGQTPNFNLRYPGSSNAPNVPQDIQNLALDIEAAILANKQIPYAPALASAPLYSFGGGVTLNGFTGIHRPNQSALGRWGRYSNVAGEYIQFSVWLDAGTYVLDHMDYLSTHFGIGAWDLDGVQKFTLDQSAVDDIGVRMIPSVGSFTITSAGMHTLRYRCLGQNGAHSVDNDFVAIYAAYLRGGRAGLFEFPNDSIPSRVSATGVFNGTSPQPSLIDYSALVPGQGPTINQLKFGIPYVPLDYVTHASGYWFESDMWLDAGTYNFDHQGGLGNTMGVGKLTINGVAVGTPQPANTIRVIGSPSAPGNGNRAGNPLVTGEIDQYDSLVGLDPQTLTVSFDGGTFAFGAINDALTNIVVSTSGWKTVRYTCTGKNSASLHEDLSIRGLFRRTA